MLRKMLKYDIKEMSKTFVPFFIAILAFSVLSAVSMRVDWLFGLFGGFTVLFGLFVALMVTSLVLIITQFYKNVLGDQGYLTNTLPVSVDTIIFSKLISAILWLCLSGIVSVLAFVIILMGGINSIGEFFIACGQVIQAIFKILSSPEYSHDALLMIFSLILFVILVLVTLANEILHIYCAMTCSQLYPFSKNRIIGSFIAYLLISIPVSIFTGLITSVIGFTGLHMESFIEKLSGPSTLMIALTTIIVIVMILNLILYFPTRYILKNKLNLE